MSTDLSLHVDLFLVVHSLQFDRQLLLRYLLVDTTLRLNGSGNVLLLAKLN